MPSRWASREYTRTTGAKLTYTIEADRHGSYRILLGEKVLKERYVPMHGMGISRFGSKREQEAAFRLAQWDIEQLRGMQEQ